MNDKDKYNEEYHFVDEPDMGSFEEHPTTHSTSSEAPKPAQTDSKFGQVFNSVKPVLDIIKQNFLLRMGLIAIGVILLITMIYRCTMDPLAKKTTEKIAPVATQSIKTVAVSVPVVTNSATLDSQSMQMNAQVQTKINALEKNQQQLQAQVTSLSSNLDTMNGNLSAMMTNMKQLSAQVTQLALVVDNQVRVTTVLVEQMKQRPQKTVQMIRRNLPIQTVSYNLQAIIPGRAWLINSNGDTLTVREGTKLAHYGVVRYIDAKRGRVLTSSGQVIRFGQDDS